MKLNCVRYEISDKVKVSIRHNRMATGAGKDNFFLRKTLPKFNQSIESGAGLRTPKTRHKSVWRPSDRCQAVMKNRIA